MDNNNDNNELWWESLPRTRLTRYSWPYSPDRPRGTRYHPFFNNILNIEIYHFTNDDMDPDDMTMNINAPTYWDVIFLDADNNIYTANMVDYFRMDTLRLIEWIALNLDRDSIPHWFIPFYIDRDTYLNQTEDTTYSFNLDIDQLQEMLTTLFN